ncbi:DUF1284 domain-containing protein [Luoshenia tenuis]|jgi:hypothetical protein|uniref:DUF1284 domain-containing protein n=1 Tax=Luoshenia tenuis TaxID=2763654 RepID=UPI003D89B9EA
MAEHWPLRPHHGLCLLFFTGKGYDAAFTRNMARVHASLKGDPSQLVRLHCGADLLCAACPERVGERCTSSKPVVYDRRVLRACGLREGEVIPFLELLEAVKRHILTAGKLETVCAGCQWLPICTERNG